jgi:hypothetical protein
MKPVAHRITLLGPAFIVVGLILVACGVAALHSGVIASRHGDISMASEPAAFFGTIALWAVFATILIGVGFHLVREAPEIDRRMDLYLAGRHGAPDESRVSVVAPPPSVSTPDDA